MRPIGRIKMNINSNPIEEFKQRQITDGAKSMTTFISITTHAHNESIASELKSFLVDGMGFEEVKTDVLSETFSIETESLVSLLKDADINAIYNELVMQYLTSYMPNFKLIAY